MNDKISDEARKCAEEIPSPATDTFKAAIIQRHLDAYHEAKSKELRDSHREVVERLKAMVEARSKTATDYLKAMDEAYQALTRAEAIQKGE